MRNIYVSGANWERYRGSNDLEKTRAQIEAEGGTIELEAFDFPGGRRFHFSDPSGNVLAVWTTR